MRRKAWHRWNSRQQTRLLFCVHWRTVRSQAPPIRPSPSHCGLLICGRQVVCLGCSGGSFSRLLFLHSPQLLVAILWLIKQNLPQRPSSLLLPPKPRQAGPRNTALREVETGVAKINKVSVTVTSAPHQVTTVTRSIPGGGGARAQAVRLVANVYRGGVVATLEEGGGGRNNPAGPQEEEERGVEGGEDSCQSVLTSSPDEHAPLLHHHHPHSGTNTNKNNNIQQPALRSQVMLESLDKHLALPTMPLASPYKHVAPPPGPPAPGPPACLLSGAPDPALGSSSGSPSEGRAAQRPSSLDLSFSSSSSSGEKIKRRVKTPYILKKPRPATWVVSMETSLDSEINHYNSNSFLKFNQSKSSMAVFMVEGMTSDPS
ncbi:unnamed protein product [Arctogadus glacialis]